MDAKKEELISEEENALFDEFDLGESEAPEPMMEAFEFDEN